MRAMKGLQHKPEPELCFSFWEEKQWRPESGGSFDGSYVKQKRLWVSNEYILYPVDFKSAESTQIKNIKTKNFRMFWVGTDFCIL